MQYTECDKRLGAASEGSADYGMGGRGGRVDGIRGPRVHTLLLLCILQPPLQNFGHPVGLSNYNDRVVVRFYEDKSDRLK